MYIRYIYDTQFIIARFLTKQHVHSVSHETEKNITVVAWKSTPQNAWYPQETPQERLKST